MDETRDERRARRKLRAPGSARALRPGLGGEGRVPLAPEAQARVNAINARLAEVDAERTKLREERRALRGRDNEEPYQV